MRKWSLAWLMVLTLTLAACGADTASTAVSAPAAPAASAAPAATTGAAATVKPTVAAVATTAPAATTGAAATVAATSAATSAATTASMAATMAPAAAAAPVALSGDPIPIGISVAQTSNTALLGQDEVNGAKIAEKYFNDHGGVNGRPIKLIYEDTAGDEQGAINAFTAQINKNKVVAIVGPTLSQQAFAADPVADKAKVPVVGPSNTADKIPGIGEYVRRVSAPVNAIAPTSIKAALAQNMSIKNVAVFYAQNDAFSVNETAVFQSTAKDLKLNVVTVQKFQTTDTDFQAQITAALALKPDLAIVSGLATDGGNLVKQLRELGFKGSIVGGNGLNTTNIFPVCKAQCDGIFIAQAYSPEFVSEINTGFKKEYQAQFSKDPPQFAAQTFSGVQVVVEALKAVDGKTKISGMSLDDLRVALNKQINDTTAKYPTPLGDISFDMGRELIQSTLYVAQVKMNPDGMTGKLTFLK